MTDEMYQKLKTPSRPPRERGLVIALWAAGILLAILLVAALWGPVYRMLFQKYLISLSNSTVYAYDQGILPAEQDGETVALSADSAYRVYSWLTATGNGRPRLLAPFRTPDLTLLYGDGSELRMWDVEPDSGQVRHTLILDYTDGAGLRYCYTNMSLTLEQLLSTVEQIPAAA